MAYMCKQPSNKSRTWMKAAPKSWKLAHQLSRGSTVVLAGRFFSVECSSFLPQTWSANQMFKCIIHAYTKWPEIDKEHYKQHNVTASVEENVIEKIPMSFDSMFLQLPGNPVPVTYVTEYDLEVKVSAVRVTQEPTAARQWHKKIPSEAEEELKCSKRLKSSTSNRVSVLDGKRQWPIHSTLGQK